MSPEQSPTLPGARPDSGQEFEFEVTLAERGYRAVLLHLSALKLRFVPPALGMAGLLAYGAGMRTEAIGLFGAAVAVPVVVWGYLAWLAGSPSARPLYAPVRYVFTDTGVRYASPEGDGAIEWGTLKRWREAAGHVLLYLSSSKYLLIPVEEMPEPVRAAFIARLTEQLGPPRNRRRGLR